MGCESLLVNNHTEIDPSRTPEEWIKECASKHPDARLPYFQYLNLHEYHPYVHQIAHAKKLGRTAAVLLGVESVRLYQTGLFVKDPTGRNTPTFWHQDLNMIPVDTNNYVTIWCPLRRLDGARDSVLMFASQSHRDFAMKHWYSPLESDGGESLTLTIRKRYNVNFYPIMDVGDCSAHHGWTYHAASDLDKSASRREAITFSYIDANAKQLPSNSIRKSRVLPREDHVSYQRWYVNAQNLTDDMATWPGLDHESLPIVWP